MLKERKIYEFGAHEMVQAIFARKLTSTQIMTACLERIREIEPTVRAWAFLDEDAAMAQAHDIDSAFSEEKERGLLYGVPVGVKDVFNTIDMPTCMGSPIWEGFMPGNDARVVTNLRRNGALIPGKTVTAEFSVHYPGPTLNPHDVKRMPGTSSTGSTVAVATGMVPVALGTQTAGSTIRPASYCGIYGYKPSFGLIPRTGVLKTLDTLDHVTWLSRNIEDLKLMLDTLRVGGENYPYINKEVDLSKKLEVDHAWKIAFVRTPMWNCAEPYTRQAMLDFVRKLKEKNINVCEVDLPPIFEKAHSVHKTIYSKALSYYFKDESIKHRDLISDVMLKMIEEGEEISFKTYQQALEDQVHLAATLDNFFRDYVIILSHATAGQAPMIQSIEKPDPCLMWTLCHVPAIGVPAFVEPEGFTFELQLVGRRYKDYSLLNFVQFLKKQGLIHDCPVVDINQETKVLAR